MKEIIFRKLILVPGKTERLVIAYNCSLKSDLRDKCAKKQVRRGRVAEALYCSETEQAIIRYPSTEFDRFADEYESQRNIAIMGENPLAREEGARGRHPRRRRPRPVPLRGMAYT